MSTPASRRRYPFEVSSQQEEDDAEADADAEAEAEGVQELSIMPRIVCVCVLYVIELGGYRE